MIVCNDCGEQNEDGTVFCTRCGVFLEWEGEKVPATQTATAVAAAPTSTPKPGPQPAPTAIEFPVDEPAARQPETVKRRPVRRAKSPVIVPTGSRICGACGMPNEGARRFCAKCGFSLAEAKVVRKAAWWRRLFGRERVYAAGTRKRPGKGRRRFRGITRLTAVLALLAGGGVLAGPQRGLVTRGIHQVQNQFGKPVQVRATGQQASGAFGRQGAQLAFDGAKNTYWAAPRTGKGAAKVPYVRATFGSPVKLVRIGITPGVSVDTPKFVAAPRPAEVEVTVTTGSGPVVKRFPLTDTPGFQELRLKANDARAVQIAVLRTTGRSKTLATAITEVEFYASR